MANLIRRGVFSSPWAFLISPNTVLCSYLRMPLFLIAPALSLSIIRLMTMSMPSELYLIWSSCEAFNSSLNALPNTKRAKLLSEVAKLVSKLGICGLKDRYITGGLDDGLEDGERLPVSGVLCCLLLERRKGGALKTLSFHRVINNDFIIIYYMGKIY